MELVPVSSPVLHQPALYVRSVTKDMLRFAERLRMACQSFHGVGLAAPQIGRPLRLAVIEYGRNLTLIDPEVIKESKEVELAVEGCLSMPGRIFLVGRPKTISITTRNSYGQVTSEEISEAYLARIVQHEMDHLAGLLISDRGVEIDEP